MNELKGPGINEIKKFIKDKKTVEFETVNNKVLKGQIEWFDNDVFHINLEDNTSITLMKSAVISYKQV